MTSNLVQIKDNVAVITGSGRGIDAATAVALAEAGADVVIAPRTKGGSGRGGRAGGEDRPQGPRRARPPQRSASGGRPGTCGGGGLRPTRFTGAEAAATSPPSAGRWSASWHLFSRKVSTGCAATNRGHGVLGTTSGAFVKAARLPCRATP